MVLKGPSWLWLTSGLSQSLQGWIISRSTISSWFFSPSKCLKPQIRSIFYVPKGGKWIVVVELQSYCSFWEDGRAVTYTLVLWFICCDFANHRKVPWRKEWQPTPVIWPGEFHEQRSLDSYNRWGHKESDTTWLTYKHTAFGMFLQNKKCIDFG